MDRTVSSADAQVISIDIGTSSVKGALVDVRARLLRVRSQPQTVISDALGGREHDTTATWISVLTVLRDLARATEPGKVQAISVTGPSGSFLITDHSGQPRSRTITWQDRRIDDTSIAPDKATIGVAWNSTVVLPKLRWHRIHETSAFAREWRLSTPQADVLRRLGSRLAYIDPSVAAMTGMYDIRASRWHESTLVAEDIPAARLPKLVPSGAVVGHLADECAGVIGLRAGIPLVLAATDGVCAELGLGVVDEGMAYAYLGTAGAFAMPVVRSVPPDVGEVSVIPSSGPGRWRLAGLASAGASAVDWILSVANVTTVQRLDAIAREVPPGSRGVVFVPALAGADGRLPDPHARAVFAGLALSTSRSDLVRAVMEGVTIQLKWFFDRIVAVSKAATEVRLAGGGSQSDVWASILADVLGVPVARATEGEAGVRGAAIYALVATGSGGSVESLAASSAPAFTRFRPDESRMAIYRDVGAALDRLRSAFVDYGLDAILGDHRRTLESNDAAGGA